MLHNRVSQSGFTVSDLTLGTFEWGSRVDQETAFELMSAYVDAGGTLLELSACTSSAHALVGSMKVPSTLRVAARVGIESIGGELRISNSRAVITEQVARLRQTLGRDCVDLVIVDAFDPHTPLTETALTLRDLQARGEIGYVAVAHHTAWQVALIRAEVDVVCAFTELSLVNRSAEDDIVPACDYMGMGVIAGAALGRGVLTGRYATGTPADSRAAHDLRQYVGAYLGPDYEPILKGVSKAAEALGVRPVDIALAWNRGLGVSSSIVAPRTVRQLTELLESDLVLEPEIRDALSQISG